MNKLAESRTKQFEAASAGFSAVISTLIPVISTPSTLVRQKRIKDVPIFSQSLTGELTQKYGKGFSTPNLWFMVNLYETYPILYALRREFKELSWTHIRTLLFIKDDLKRQFYATLCLKEHWSTRTLENRIGTMLYDRTALSKLPEKTIAMQLKGRPHFLFSAEREFGRAN